MNLLDQEFRAISAAGEEPVTQKNAATIVVYLEQLSRAGKTADLSPEQKEAIESAMETIDKRLNAALSAESPEAQKARVDEAVRDFEELQRTLAQ